ncbi:hypothetical protein D791_01448 [Nitrincola nitratireducens]|uniref:Uncharacterized protein n=1 Tax=Nitrincola nitratireducens TaxID=1229521 RepID=W9VMD1_9GAMM|nr:hypothetical protein D791_01448 [Nitrincola nitratireducens]
MLWLNQFLIYVIQWLRMGVLRYSSFGLNVGSVSPIQLVRSES